MNQHLNIFRFYNESKEIEIIENNISRALCICLANNSLLLDNILKLILSKTDFNSLFSSITNEMDITIDLQRNTANIDLESLEKIYAIALTSDRNLNMSDFFEQDKKEKINITDIFISIKDIAIIIEVKRTNENCKEQLYNQCLSFLESKSIEKKNIIPKTISWQEIIFQMEQSNNLEKLSHQSSVFVRDFLDLIEKRYPKWFEAKPFYNLSFENKNYQIKQRLKQAIHNSEFELLPSKESVSFELSRDWANQVLLMVENDYIIFRIYPANTKGQGYHVFGKNKTLDWTKIEELKVESESYKLFTQNHLKFSHFQGSFISGLWFTDDVLKKNKNIATSKNFYSNSGKWTRSGQNRNWQKFEEFMDEYFDISSFDWRGKSDWQNKFINMDKGFVNLSIGFEVSLFVPYSKFKNLDKKDEDIEKVSKFIENITKSLIKLIEE